MRPTEGDRILWEVLQESKTAKDVMRRFAEDPLVLKCVQATMDESDAEGPQPGNVKHQRIRTMLVELLTNMYVS
jgi:hypothetical protein